MINQSVPRVFASLLRLFAAVVSIALAVPADATDLVRKPMIVSGGTHTLALKMDGTVWAWGQNAYGQLGLGTVTTADQTFPKQVKYFKDTTTGIDRRVVALAAGTSHSMALTEDGIVYVWGRNNYGQIGNGTTTGNYSTPQEVTTFQVKTEAGYVSNFTVWDPANRSYKPVSNPRVRAIAAGANHCVVVTEPSEYQLPKDDYPRDVLQWQYVFGWGKNDFGQLGVNDRVNKTYPTYYSFGLWPNGAATGGADMSVESIAAGANHTVLTYGVRDEYGYMCWLVGAGDNSSHQVPNGDNAVEQNFTQRAGSFWSSRRMTVDAGSNYTIVHYQHEDAGGKLLWGTGLNSSGQLGLDYLNGGVGSTATYSSGFPYTLYDRTMQALPTGGFDNMRSMAIGGNHGLLAMNDGSVYVWGLNQSSGVQLYTLGLGDTAGATGVASPLANAKAPRLNPFVADIVIVAAGGNSTFAVKSDGTVMCWGSNGQGQLGIGNTNAYRKTPGPVPEPDPLVGGTFKLWHDTDGDKMPDEWEQAYFGTLARDGTEDFDHDDVLDKDEWLAGLDPTNPDSDGDLYPDGEEITLKQFDPTFFDPPSADYDHDGLTNYQERIYRTNPTLADSDGDGTSDGAEVANSTNPAFPGDANAPPLEPELMDLTLTVGDPSSSESERYKLVVRDAKENVILEHQSVTYGDVATATYRVKRQPYSFEVVHLGTKPSYFRETGISNYDWVAAVSCNVSLMEVSDPDHILISYEDFPNSTFLIAGKRAFLKWKDQPESCDPLARLNSANEASGPSHRKISLTGLPLADAKPQAKDETDQPAEETFVDALTLQLRHSTTDIFVPLVGAESTLSVRREAITETWSTHPGLQPQEYMNRPFGLGWTSNLCANIEFVYRTLNGPVPTCAEDRLEPDLAIVTDETGAQHRFLTIWDNTNPANVSPFFLPYPSNRNEADSFLNELTAIADGTGNYTYTFRKKFGTTLTYSQIQPGLDQTKATNYATPPDEVTYRHSRLVQAVDRLGNKLEYEYNDGSGVSLIPSKITANGNRSLTITKSGGTNGRILSITDPRGYTTSYTYASKGYQPPNQYFVNFYDVLATVTSPETTTVKRYDYAGGGPELDTTPYATGTPPPQDAYYFHSSLSKFTDPRGNVTTITYLRDYIRRSYSSAIDNYYLTPGQPPVVAEVTLPAITGQPTLAKATFRNLSEIQVGYTGDAEPQPLLKGQRLLQVTDAGGKSWSYRFDQPLIVEQDEFENLLYRSDDPRTTPFLVLYQTLQITDPENLQETFTFDPHAGMALITIHDRHGHATAFEHADAWTVQQQPKFAWLPNGYYVQAHSDPTKQVNALGKAKRFAYNAERIMTDVWDEEGRHTQYEVQAGTGLRLWERIYEADGATLRQETQFEYGHPSFPAFLTRTTVHQHNGDPGWAQNLVTEYTPDQYGYVQAKKVWEGTKWLTTSYVHDANGNKTSETDPRLNPTSFTYDKLNRLKTVTYPIPAGLTGPITKTYDYDASSNKIKEKDERGYYTLWAYDGRNRVIQQARDMNGDAILNAGDLTTAYAYNDLNSRTTVTDPRQKTSTTTYDALQRPWIVTNPLNEKTTYEYGENSGASSFDVSAFKPTHITNSRNYQTTILYDELYRPITKWEQYAFEMEAVTDTEYDSVGNPTKVWDPLNPKGGANSHAIINEYDALNRLVKTTYQDQTSVQTKFTMTGLKWQTFDELQRMTDREYDLAGRLVKTFSPAVFDAASVENRRAITGTEYDDAGNVLKTTDPRGHVWDFAYDARNRKRDEHGPAVVDSEHNGVLARPNTHWDYDAVGNLTAVTDARGKTTETRYDRANRPDQVTAPEVLLPNGTMARPVTKTTYDANGNVLTVVDPNNHTTTNTYDDANRLSTTTNAANEVVTYRHDKSGNPQSVKDGKNQTTYFTYDGLNRLSLQTDPAQHSLVYTYDGINKTGRIDERARLTTYSYDTRHRLAKVKYHTGNTAASGEVNNAINARQEYTYDVAGNLESVTESAKGGLANVVHTYDALNRVKTETSSGVTHQYQYDLAGNRRKVTLGETNRITESQFDALNRVIEESEGTVGSPPRVTRYGYDLNGNLISLLQPNGDAENRTYDALGRLISNEHRNSAQALLESYVQSWDSPGLLVKVVETYATASLNRTRELAYDNADRLREEKVTDPANAVETTTYTYDAASTRTSKVVVGGANPGTWTYLPNSLNQITAVTGPNVNASFTYDFNGNRYQRTGAGLGGFATYGYDYENRLISLSQGGATYNYTYDYRTRRVKRDEGGAITEVIFSGGLSAFEKQGGSVQVEYIRGKDLAGGVGGLRYSLRGGAPLFTHENGRGDVVGQTDGAGNLTYQAAYEAFGKHGAEFGSSPDRARANTKEEDPSGLLNEGMRYRDLETGTFITRDPAGFVDGPNLYAYVRQNPWSKFDPEGLADLSLSDVFAPVTASVARGGRSPWGGQRGAVEHSKTVTRPVLTTVAVGLYAAAAAPVAGTAAVEAAPILPVVAARVTVAALTHPVAAAAAAEGAIVGGAVYHDTKDLTAALTSAGLTGVHVWAASGSGSPSGASARKTATRLPQDVAVNPVPPAALPTNRPIGQSATQNADAQDQVQRWRQDGYSNIRVDQRQVNAQGARVGTNRPDLQGTNPMGERQYIEYDTSRSSRGPGHAARLKANDPHGKVTQKRVD